MDINNNNNEYYDIIIRKIIKYTKIKTSLCNTHFVINNIISLVFAITSYMYKDHYLYNSTHRICFSYKYFFLLVPSVTRVTFISSSGTFLFIFL